MTARFTHAEIARAAKVAAEAGVSVTLEAPDGRKVIVAVRKQIGAEAYDIHGLRYAAAAELAALGCSDELIQSVTGHQTRAMVAKYAGAARQKTRAKEAQEKRK